MSRSFGKSDENRDQSGREREEGGERVEGAVVLVVGEGGERREDRTMRPKERERGKRIPISVRDV